MQTFLPYPDIALSVKCLDDKRLGKQRVEALQILKALSDPKYGWQEHPAVKMWRGCENVLSLYMNTCIQQWIRRGFKNKMMLVELSRCVMTYPSWYGDKAFHDSHKSNLLLKDPRHYEQFNWNVPNNLYYVWPA